MIAWCSVVVIMANLLRLAGQKKDDSVWKWFEYCSDVDKCKCLVTDSKDKQCNAKLSGKNPTNLKASKALRVHSTHVFDDLTVFLPFPCTSPLGLRLGLGIRVRGHG